MAWPLACSLLTPCDANAAFVSFHCCHAFSICQLPLLSCIWHLLASTALWKDPTDRPALPVLLLHALQMVPMGTMPGPGMVPMGMPMPYGGPHGGGGGPGGGGGGKPDERGE